MDSSGSNNQKPIIGLTTYLEQAQTGVWDVRAAFLPAVYFDAINRAGGIAVLLPRSRSIRESPPACSTDSMA